MSRARSVIVGFGNPILSDDAVGIVVARRVYESLDGDSDVDFMEAGVGGFELVENLAGYHKAVIVDARQTDGGAAGQFSLVDLACVDPAEVPVMTHHVGLIEGLALARRLDMDVPETIHLYGIEVEDVTTFGTSMTHAVTAAVPRVVEHILAAEFGEGA